jgi:hypothetical protein
MINRKNIPINRCINREHDMLNSDAVCGSCCSPYFNYVENSSSYTTVDTNNSNSLYNNSLISDVYNKGHNHLKDRVCIHPPKNLRIKYIGFIYNDINYIVDIDQKNVIYKPIKESVYKKYNVKVYVQVSPIDKSYSLSFNLYQELSFVEVIIYPNCVDDCTVIINNTNTNHKEIMSNDYVTYEYFKIANMVDENLNLVTLVDYEDVFALGTTQLANLYTYPETLDLIKSFIDATYKEKDSDKVIKEFLSNIKKRLVQFIENSKKEENITEEVVDITKDDSSKSETVDISDNSSENGEKNE